MALGDAEGLRRLYMRIVDALQLSVTPERSYEALATELAGLSQAIGVEQPNHDELDNDRATRKRFHEALKHSRFKWRSLQSLAATAGVSEEIAANLLRADDDVRFSRGRSGDIIVGPRSRVGQGSS